MLLLLLSLLQVTGRQYERWGCGGGICPSVNKCVNISIFENIAHFTRTGVLGWVCVCVCAETT